MRYAINIGLLIAYVALVPVLGFFTATGIYLITHMTYLGIRPFPLVLAVTAGGLVFLYALFGYMLGVYIPHGILY